MAKSEETREQARTGRPGLDDDSGLFAEASARLGDLRVHLLELWDVKVAELRLAVWRKAFAIVALVLGAVFVAALLAAAAFFLLAGVADGLTSVFSSRFLGGVATGILGLGLVAAALWLAKRKLATKAVDASERDRT